MSLYPSMMVLNRNVFLLRILGPETLYRVAAQVRQAQEAHTENLHAYRRAFLDSDAPGMADSRARQADSKERIRVAYDAFVTEANEAVAVPASLSGSAVQLK